MSMTSLYGLANRDQTILSDNLLEAGVICMCIF